MAQTSKLTPALWGGLFMGVLSALPMISVGNCCCLWVTGGGVIAAYLLQQNQVEPIEIGDGALVGLLSGIIGAVVSLVLSIPISLFMGPLQGRIMQGLLDNIQNLPPEVESAVDSFAGTGAAVGFGILGALIGFGIMLMLGMIFSTLGGLIGAVIFQKKNASPIEGPPPQTQSF